MIANIASGLVYQDQKEIRAFVARLLKSHPLIGSWENRCDPSRVVVVKPNWVQESHEDIQNEWEPVITHPALVLAVVEEVAQVLAGQGTICVSDGPHTYADFSAIIARGDLASQVLEVGHRWPNLKIELLDLRREIWVRKEGVVVDRMPNQEDPRGYVRVDLGKNSHFWGHKGEGRFYGADYDQSVVNGHHKGDLQEYLLSGTAVKCDLFINLPKLKTHKKTGITCCLKNLVGINGDKNWLPHHTEGSPEAGGDEFPNSGLSAVLEGHIKRTLRTAALKVPGVGTWVYRKARNAGKAMLGGSDETIRNGNWHGNDTCWRMVLDLNRALFYANAEGTLLPGGAAKPYIAIVDGIVGGEGEGPLCPEPVNSGVLIGGYNPVVVDAVAARLMGYDPAKLAMIREGFAPHPYPLIEGMMNQIKVFNHSTGQDVALDDIGPVLGRCFKPHFGWKNHLTHELS